MIRFIYIGDQISEDSKEFAFYDTIIDQFVEFDNQVVFDSLEDFKLYSGDSKYNRCYSLILKNLVYKKDK